MVLIISREWAGLNMKTFVTSQTHAALGHVVYMLYRALSSRYKLKSTQFFHETGSLKKLAASMFSLTQVRLKCRIAAGELEQHG